MAKKVKVQNEVEVTTKVVKCACKHPFQDKEYGAGYRLHNRGGKVGNSTTWICTVCNKRQ